MSNYKANAIEILIIKCVSKLRTALSINTMKESILFQARSQSQLIHSKNQIKI